MAAALNDKLKQILDGKVFVTLSTIQPDGSPQSSPVWVTRDGDELLISTTTDRRKYLNLRRDPRATVVVLDPDEPYSYAEIRGTVEMTTEGGRELIDELARKYVGASSYADWNPGAGQDAPRVVVRVVPRKVVGRLT
ncbi:PPOX class F420-dependent oxidoreductase [Streptomyces sp. 6N223]|uniref:PPOX class F420-dependent oxidoreductase n=1 Tax=Streptomyces sp. 6N223 TaxID=3457412 RepID=UPI003FD60649